MLKSGNDVVLALMPFVSLTHPSLALGCLAGALRRAGISALSLYFSLDFAEAIGIRNYYHLSYSTCHGDWVFSRAAFPEMKRSDESFHEIYPCSLSRENLLKVRDDAEGFIDRCARQVLALNPKIVGCSSSFHQTCASLALLRRIREAAPEVATVMGGANCESAMGGELHRSFPWVDYVFSGEADESFPDFCRAFLAGENIGGAGGWNRPEVLTPHDRCPEGNFREPGRGTVADISGLPIPFFDDYFEALGKSGIRDKIIPGLVLETSRGCWWGAKKPCAFCGLNGLSGNHRVKNPDKAYREITELAKRHGMTSVQISDNIIDPSHIEQLLPRFEGAGMNFMYETPATLSREQMRKLSDAGARQMQPGIEQLHDGSLAALGKRNKVFHNIRFLKFALEYGIYAAWNCLYGFPGENDAWHGEAADLVPLLTHLQPPTSAMEVRFYRFSPYFNEPDRYGLTLKPMRFYSHIYPLDEEALSRMAYFFERVPAPGETAAPPERTEQTHQIHQNHPKPGLERLLRSLYEWKKLFPPVFAEDRRESPVLAMTRNASGALVIEDTRPIATAPRFSFGGIEAAAYAAADQGRTAEEIARVLSEQGFPGLPKKPKKSKTLPRDVENILQGFVDSRLMVKLGETGETRTKYLALAAAPFRGYLPEELTPGGWYRRKRRAR